MNRFMWIMLSLMLLVGCRQRQSGVMFNPTQNAPKLSESEIRDAVEAKKAELAPVNYKDFFNDTRLKLTILPPKPCESISEEASDLVAVKMMGILSEGGITGMGGNPCFVLAATMTPKSGHTTSGVRSRTVSSYTINLYIANMISDEIYGSYSFEVSGAGKTLKEASVVAASSISNSSEIQQFIANSTNKIFDWYNFHSETFKAQVTDLIGQEMYDEARILLSSVPENTVCFDYARTQRDVVLSGYREQMGNKYFILMKDAIATAGTECNPMIASYYSLIPNGCSQKDLANKFYDTYLNRLDEAIRHKMYKEQVEVETQRLQAEAELVANQALLQKNMQSANQPSSPFGSILKNVVQLGVGKLLRWLIA